jgi:sigma-B regulation protein RsbU (phosphoserine phosphatase)
MAKKTKKQIERDEQIYQLTTLAAGEFSLQEVLDKLAEAAVKIVKVKACSIRLLDEEAGELKMRSTYGLSEEYRNKGEVSKNETVIKAAFAGEAVVLDDVRVDGRVKYKEAAIKEGLVSQLTVAMQFRSRDMGVLRLYSPKPMHFDEDDINLARAVASQCAVAITNARLYAKALEGARMAEQMRLAGVIQRRMIPEKSPQIPGLDIAATYIPCFDVGGDFYSFHQLGKNSIDVAIADVIGKGIPAAIMMSSFRGAVKAFIDTVGDFPVHCENRDKVDCYKEITDLEKGGLVLGVDPEAEYEVETVKLKEGDCLLFYTDGLIDAANFDGELWGKERMLDAAKKFTSHSAEQMIQDVLGYRRRFVGLARQIDDTSMVVVRIENGEWRM